MSVHAVCSNASVQDLEEYRSYTACHPWGELGEGHMGPVFTNSCAFLTVSEWKVTHERGVL